MAEADVTYSNVKFTRQSTKDEAPAVVYSDVKMSRTKHPVCPKCAIDAQQAGQCIRSKVTTVVLLVLIGILVVTVIALAVKINSRPKMNTTSSPPPAVRNLTCLKCEPGWEKHGGNCYNFSTTKSSWNDSRRSCADHGSDLVKIDSREEQTHLEGRVRNLMQENNDKFWIGLTDSVGEGKWFWVDGSALDESLSFWNQSQPDNKSPDHSPESDCVRMGKKVRPDDLKSWFDTSCNYLQKSICEKPAGQSSCVSL